VAQAVRAVRGQTLTEGIGEGGHGRDGPPLLRRVVLVAGDAADNAGLADAVRVTRVRIPADAKAV